MLINSSIPNLIGGVSQQPELLSQQGTVRELLNGSCPPSVGLVKRFGTEHMRGLDFAPSTGLATLLDYGDRGVYAFAIQDDGTIKVFSPNSTIAMPLYDSTGAAITGPVSYFASANAREQLRVVRQADTVFVINKSAIVTSTTGTPATSWPGLIWFKAGSYGRKYSITIPGWGTAWYLTPDGGSSNQVLETGTATIAAKLLEMLQGGVSGSSGSGTGNASWGGPGVAYTATTVTRIGSILAFGVGGTGIKVDDDYGGQYISYIYKSVRALSELPGRNVPDGFYIKVSPSESTAGSYYLKYSSTAATWGEIANPSAAPKLVNLASLPRRLYPYLDGMKVDYLPWVTRSAGDDNTNPHPAFVGSTINDLFFIQDRMGILSGEGANFSEVSVYGNFYRTTVMDLLDDDPIEITVSHPKVSTLRHAVPFSRRLLLFSTEAQFEVTFGDVLTPKSAAAALVSEFDASTLVRPVGANTSLFFPAVRGGHSIVREYFLDSTTTDGAERADDITAQVPTYVPSDVHSMASSSAHNMLFCLTRSEPSSIYVYQFYTSGTQRLQSAWHKWTFTDPVLAMEVIDGYLWLGVYREDSGLMLERIYLGAAQDTPRLDRSLDAGTIPATLRVDTDGNKFTDYTSPYPASADMVMVVNGGLLAPTSVSGFMVSFPGDLVGKGGMIGHPFTMRAAIGRLMVRVQRGQGTAGVTLGRTQLGRMWTSYDGYGQFDVEVARKADGTTYAYRCTGRQIGGSTVGGPLYGPGRFGNPIKMANTDATITITAPQPLSPALLSIDWEGYHVTRGQSA